MSKARLLGTAITGTVLTLSATQGGDTVGPLTIPSWGTNFTAPDISGSPVITGTMEVGETLTAVPASVTGNPTPTRSWQWRKDGAAISGATSITYVLQAGDDPGVITVVQTETNDGGTASAVSAPRSVGVAEIEYQIVYTGTQNAGGTLADSFTVPVPATLTGDWTIYVMMGSTDTFLALDVDSTPATRIVPSAPGAGNSTAGAGGRMSLFSVALTGLTGSGTLALDATLESTDSEYCVTVFAVRGGVLQEQYDELFLASGAGGELAWAGIEVPGDGALMMGLTSGKQNVHAPEGEIIIPEWSSLDQQAIHFAAGDVDAHSLSWRTLVPAGVYDEGVTFNSGAADRVTAALLVFVPIGAPIPDPTVSLWTMTDEAAITGDIARVDVQGNPYLDGFRVSYFEIEKQLAGGTVIERVLGGGANNYVRRHRMDANTTTTCRLRPVYRNQTTGAFFTADWSAPLDVTTTTGAARVSLTSTLATAYTDEAFILETNSRGFNTLRNQMYGMDFWTTVADVAEEGDLEHLPAIYVAEHGEKVRHICRAQKWAFAAKTTGTKTFTTTVRDRLGSVATASLDVEIVDIVTAFDPGDIYALSSANNFTGVPVGANTYTSYAAIKANVPTSGAVLIMIDEDEESGDGAVWDLTASGLTEVHFRSYGPGLRTPKMDIGIKIACPRASVSRVDIRTAYDPTDYPTGVSFRPVTGIDTSLCGHASVANTFVEGANIAFQMPRKNRTCAYFDVRADKWANFAFFGDDVGKYAIFGANVIQDPNTIRAIGKYESDAPVFPDHGCHRTSRPTEDYAIAKLIGFCGTSWGGVQSPQPTLRLMGSGATPRPLEQMVSQCSMLGTGQGLGHTSRGGGVAFSRPQDIRVDSCVVYAAHSSLNALAIKCGLTTITNCKLVSPGGPRELDPFSATDTGGSGFRAPFQFEADRESKILFTLEDNDNNPVEIRFCTAIDLNENGETNKSSYVRAEQVSNRNMNDVTFLNLAEHAPNYVNSLTSDGPFDSAFHGVSHPYQQRLYFDPVSETVVTETQYGVPDDAMATWRPAAGAAVIGTATGLIEVRDFYGTLRPSSGATRGHAEPV